MRLMAGPEDILADNKRKCKTGGVQANRDRLWDGIYGEYQRAWRLKKKHNHWL